MSLPNSPTSIKESKWDKFVSKLNPMLVREVRQLGHGRFLIITVWLFLITLFALALGVYATSTQASMRGEGRIILTGCYVVLSIVGIGLIPLYLFGSMRQEVRSGSLELLLLTKLTPSRIVRGKLLVGLVLYGGFALLCAPLLAFCVTLNEVTVKLIIKTLLVPLLLSIATMAITLPLGALARNRAREVVVSALLLFALAISAYVSMAILVVSHYRGNLDFLLSLVSCVALFTSTCYIVASHLLRPEGKNKVVALRVLNAVMAVCAGIGVAFTVYWYNAIRDYHSPPSYRSEILEILAISVGVTSLFLSVGLAFFAVTESEGITAYAKKKLALSRFSFVPRVVTLPGSAAAYIWCVLLCLMAGMIMHCIFASRPSTSMNIGLLQSMMWYAILWVVFYLGVFSLISRLFTLKNKALARGLIVVGFICIQVFTHILGELFALPKNSVFWSFDVITHLQYFHVYSSEEKFTLLRSTNINHWYVLLSAIGVVVALHVPAWIRVVREIKSTRSLKPSQSS